MNYENIFLSEEERIEKERQENIKKYGLNDLTLLETDQIFGSKEKEQSEIFKKYGTRAAITDFAVVLGGFISDDDYTNEGVSLANRTGWWWTKTPYDNNARAVDLSGHKNWSNVFIRSGGCRPAIPFSSISKICTNKVRDNNGLLEVEYGEYPQWICSKSLSEELEELYTSDKLTKTGKIYTTDSNKYDAYDEDFEPQQHIEYIYNDKKYVRVKVNSYFDGEEFLLSNGEKYKDGDYVWIGVSPIKWLVDEEIDIAITKNIIVAGIQFNKERNYTGNNFNEMNIKKFMDNYLSKEIIPDRISYEFNFEEKEETLEEALINMKRKMKEILGEEYSYLLNKTQEEPFQKIKK